MGIEIGAAVGGLAVALARVVDAVGVAIARPQMGVDGGDLLLAPGAQFGGGWFVAAQIGDARQLLAGVSQGHARPAAFTATIAAGAIDGVGPVAVAHQHQAVFAQLAVVKTQGVQTVFVPARRIAVDVGDVFVRQGRIAGGVPGADDADHQPDTAVVVHLMHQRVIGAFAFAGGPHLEVAVLLLRRGDFAHGLEGILRCVHGIAEGILENITQGIGNAVAPEAGLPGDLLFHQRLAALLRS